MFRKTSAILFVLITSLGGTAHASSINIPYFVKETVKITENIVLFPFRLIRDIFDPPPPPVLVPYYYASVPAAYPAATQLPMAAPTMSAPAPQPAAPAAVPASETFEIHLPNPNGSFTSITLRKTERGFLGPQGEFYADHPTEDQLKTRYGK
jgi:hypothetical protein